MENISYTIHKTANEKFGISAVKPYQLLVMHRVLEHQNTHGEVQNQIVILPTGTGKSLCFLLPASILNGITIIIYPLLALMNDQIFSLEKNGIKCVCLRGGQTKSQRNSVFSKIESGTKIVITNPETLKQRSVLERLAKFNIELLVIDEAHVIAQWGESFRPAYLELSEDIKILKPHQILSFTATASEQTISKITKCLYSKPPIIVHGDSDRENIFYRAFPTLNKKQALIQILKTCSRPAIVFCRIRLDTYELCHLMLRFYTDIPMRFYHAGLSSQERKCIEKWFLESSNGVLFATCAYGLGVNKPNIRTVIHYSLPENVEEYLQESGRAGRDRMPSEAIAIITNNDNGAIASVFKGNMCRRHELLKVLGQDKEECSGCDICTNQVIQKPYGETTIMRLIKFRPLRHTSHSAAKLLSGSRFCSDVPTASRTDQYYHALDYDEDFLEEAISFMNFRTLTKRKLLAWRKNKRERRRQKEH